MQLAFLSYQRGRVARACKGMGAPLMWLLACSAAPACSAFRQAPFTLMTRQASSWCCPSPAAGLPRCLAAGLSGCLAAWLQG
jgi:hypothetical protein